MSECRTCEYCGSVVSNYVRKRCPECRLLVCRSCWREDVKACDACFTLLDRKLITARELE